MRALSELLLAKADMSCNGNDPDGQHPIALSMISGRVQAPPQRVWKSMPSTMVRKFPLLAGAGQSLQPGRMGRLKAETSGSDASAMSMVLFVECGFGNDQHGQNPTKAAVRACRNAIEFNSIPSIRAIVPGGYEGMKLRVQIALPIKYHSKVDLKQVAEVFPYGNLLPIELMDGGASFGSGIAIEALGDKSDEMVIANACVTVGY
eukprot:gnl/TRDRNA2_/TRDRNA2_91304_c0_seq1.p1 gnl/TRDRNA2_/TRDRNA2_91304_c0~~gnl/TRDRNA2_/TRDRNA2_91304_c0_seq1.p1  ORF type:complete len:205 (+),score=28.51 gnl/TRDRNA2_/TRDRNA2_91304_c0_seq1:54-668(+)